MTTTAGAATTSSLAAPRWADLPPDLLRAVSGRLHDAAEFTRFHAVCKAWRSAVPSPTTTTFFPWLVAPRDDYSALKFIRCVFSKASFRAAAPVWFGKHGWVARADGAAAWLFAALPEPRLVHPLTGTRSALRPPFFPDDDAKKGVMENSCGVIYDDGTTFLHNLSGSDYLDEDSDSDDSIRALGLTLVFRAAILLAGHTEWRFVQSAIDARNPIGHYLAAYRDGKIVVSVDSKIHYRGSNIHDRDLVLALSSGADTGSSDLQVHTCETARWMRDDEVVTYRPEATHVLESRGELLRVSVMALRDGNLGGQRAAEHARALAVSVHALETVEDAGGRSRSVKWARRDGRSLADRALFLGFPTSFSVDASRFHGAEDDVIGGCAYFFHSWSLGAGAARSPCRLFRYSLVDRKAKFMEEVPSQWSVPRERCVWLLPQPAIAPIEVIRERLEAPNEEYRSTIRMEGRPKHSETFLKVVVVVRNLPPSVDSSRVSRFFSKHGKVAAAEVTSPGTARVTIVTTDEPDDVEAALDGLVMDGRTLVVSRMRKKQSQRGRGNAFG